MSRESLVVIPTGSLEQHGHHLPLFTDTLIVTAVAESVEKRLPSSLLLTPTLWLGASGHHLAFPGSLSANFESYMGSIADIVDSLLRHGFRKFYILNGHGGNESPNDMVARKLKASNPTTTIAQSSYFRFCSEAIAQTLEGPLKVMRHGCEAETSLMMYLHPELVRREHLRNDGLASDPPLFGPIHHFDEISEAGSVGYATLGSPEKGKVIFEAAIEGLVAELSAIANGYVLRGLQSS